MKRIAFILCLLWGAQNATAGLLIEPYVGTAAGTYNHETTTNGYSVGSPADATVSGATYGGRLGFKVLLFWTALDYTGVNFTTKYNKPLTTPDGTVRGDFVFADVGLDLPFFVRLYGGYGFYNSMKATGNDSKGAPGEEILSGGSAVKAGMGISLFMFFSLNVEYIKPTFSKASISSSSGSLYDGSLDGNFKSLDTSFTMATLSFPIDLF